MQWLFHAPISPDALQRHGHTIHLPAELNLPETAPPEEVLAAAQAKQWDIFTADSRLAKKVFETRQPFRRCIVYLLPDAGDSGEAIDRLFARFKRLTPGRLYTITAHRVKVRQLPTAGAGI